MKRRERNAQTLSAYCDAAEDIRKKNVLAGVIFLNGEQADLFYFNISCYVRTDR